MVVVENVVLAALEGRDCQGFHNLCRLQVRVGKGMGAGWIFQPSPYPYPWRRLVGYPPWFLIVISEFESRSTMTNLVDLAFHHSYNITLGSKKRERMQSKVINLFTTLILNAC